MVRSLSLAAYMTYARRATKAPPAPDIARPEGELLWAHASNAARADALVQLAIRLQQQRPGVHILLTTPKGICPVTPDDGLVIWQEVPEDTIVSANAFLDHWAPDVCIWSGSDLQPAMLICSSQANVPLFLIDVDENQLSKPGWRWFPDLPKALLGQFRLIMVHSIEAAMKLHKIGVEDVEIHVTGALQEGAMAPPYDSTTREELAAILLGRPIWLAARIERGELETVLEAHRHTSKLSHRSLLIIVPGHAGETKDFKALLKQQGWRYGLWSEGEMPGENTQILLADSHELGLWYALAPVSFMGNSLYAGMSGHDPNAPAAHGSAIIYGPHVGTYLDQYSRYANAGAARLVRDENTLSTAVQELISPDKSAAMAHAAWDVVSKGAVVTDLIIDLIKNQLDAPEKTP